MNTKKQAQLIIDRDRHRRFKAAASFMGLNLIQATEKAIDAFLLAAEITT